MRTWKVRTEHLLYWITPLIITFILFGLLSFCGQNFNSVSQCSCNIVLTHSFLTLVWSSTIVKLSGAFLPIVIHTHLYFVSHREDGTASTAGAVLWLGRMSSIRKGKQKKKEKKKKGWEHFFPYWWAQQHFQVWASLEQWMGFGILKLSWVHSPFTVMDDCTLCS